MVLTDDLPADPVDVVDVVIKLKTARAPRPSVAVP